MLLSIQFPLSDARAFCEGEARLLGRPTWPSASPDIDFVRSFGSVRKRMLGGLTGWVGENAICEAGRALRFFKIPSFQDSESKLRIPLKVAFRRFFFDGQAVGKFEVGLTTESHDTANLTGRQTWALTEHILSLPIVVPAISNKAVSGELAGKAASSELGRAGKHLARFYSASTLSHPPPINLQDWWVRPGAPLLFLVHKTSEYIRVPFRGRSIPTYKFDRYGWKLHNCEVPYAGKSLRMWVLKLTRYASYREARALRICLMRLHAEHEALRLILQNIAVQKINPTPRSTSSYILQHYLNEATRRISRLDFEAERLIDSSHFAELARDSEDFINPGERDALLNSLRNLDVRRNIFNKVKQYVETGIQINEVNINIKEARMDDTGDTYNISGGQNVGFGRDSLLYDNVFNQWKESSANPNLADLAKELTTLRSELENQATDPDDYVAVVAIADAEAAAKKGKGPEAFEYLARVGKKSLDIATTIGIPIAIEALKKALWG